MFQVLISFLIWTWALESRKVKRQWFYWRRKLIELVVLSWKLLFHCPYKKQFRSKWKSPIHIMFVYIHRWWRLSRSTYYHCVYRIGMWRSPSRSFHFYMHYLHDLYNHQSFAKFTYIMQPPHLRQTFEAPELWRTWRNAVRLWKIVCEINFCGKIAKFCILNKCHFLKICGNLMPQGLQFP